MMALFTDGPINENADLQNHDSAIQDVATVEGIDLNAKIKLAQECIGDELLTFLLHNLTRDRRAETRRVIGLRDVVVTAPLRRWHALASLAMCYGDAYGHQLNERYQAKWQEYESLALRACEQYLDVGVGLVLDPVPRAATPTVSLTVGDGNPARYYAAVCWLNAQGHEGAPSEAVIVDTSMGAEITLAAQQPPHDASSWNVYLGAEPMALMRQNTAPVPAGTSWQTIAQTLAQGAPPKQGQTPEWFLVDNRVLLRG
jgi:hypothetical protein